MQAPVKIVNENVLDVQCIYTADGTLGVNPSECDETDGFSSKLKVFDRFGGTMLFMSTKKCLRKIAIVWIYLPNSNQHRLY